MIMLANVSSIALGWVGLGQSDDGLGWIGSHKMDPCTDLPQATHMRPQGGADLRFCSPQPDTSLYCKTMERTRH